MIFEVDWQLLLKWHSAYGFLLKSKVTQSLTPVQGSSQKGHSAINQVTQQVVETEIVHLHQCLALVCSWICNIALTMWSKHATTWHVAIMVLLMSTYGSMLRHID